MSKSSLVLGLSGRGLKDLDMFSKSDPYVVISRQSTNGGPWVVVRTSETIKNNLNPDWKEFLIYDSELESGTNDDIQLEVYDDDGKPGRDRKDESIGFAATRLRDLTAGSSITIRDRKKGKETGKILIRSLKRNSPESKSESSPATGGGYPTTTGGYPAPGGGYPPATGGYPQATSGYPPSATGGYHTEGHTMPGAPGFVYPGSNPGSNIYPTVPPTASVDLPYPVQPGTQGPSATRMYSGPSPPQDPNKHQGLIAQMHSIVTPKSVGGGGFKMP